MWTLYDKLIMRPPPKVAMASRLVKGGAALSAPMPIVKSNVNAFFDRGHKARSSIAQPQPWYLGAHGGLSGFAGFGDIDLVPGVTFTNNDAHSDFVSGLPAGNWRDGGGSWDGVSQAIISAFTQALNRAENSAPRGAMEADAVKAELKGYVKQLDSLQRFGMGGRSAGQDQQYRGTMKAAKSLLMAGTSRLNAAVAADTTEAQSYGGTGTGTGVSTPPSGGVPRGGARDGGAAAPGGTSYASGAATAADTGGGLFSNPLVLGGIGVVALGGLWYFLKKR